MTYNDNQSATGSITQPIFFQPNLIATSWASTSIADLLIYGYISICVSNYKQTGHISFDDAGENTRIGGNGSLFIKKRLLGADGHLNIVLAFVR